MAVLLQLLQSLLSERRQIGLQVAGGAGLPRSFRRSGRAAHRLQRHASAADHFFVDISRNWRSTNACSSGLSCFESAARWNASRASAN